MTYVKNFQGNKEIFLKNKHRKKNRISKFARKQGNKETRKNQKLINKQNNFQVCKETRKQGNKEIFVFSKIYLTTAYI